MRCRAGECSEWERRPCASQRGSFCCTISVEQLQQNTARPWTQEGGLQGALKMSATISGVILELLVTVLIGIVLFSVGNRVLARRSRQAGSNTTTTGDLARLAKGLNTTSAELDKILEKIVEVAQNRAAASITLQEEMKRLEEAEEEYLVQIEMLKNEPLRVVSDLLNELHPTQIRSARNDFRLFLAGVLLSAIVSVLWDLLKIGGSISTGLP